MASFPIHSFSHTSTYLVALTLALVSHRTFKSLATCRLALLKDNTFGPARVSGRYWRCHDRADLEQLWSLTMSVGANHKAVAISTTLLIPMNAGFSIVYSI